MRRSIVAIERPRVAGEVREQPAHLDQSPRPVSPSVYDGRRAHLPEECPLAAARDRVRDCRRTGGRRGHRLSAAG